MSVEKNSLTSVKVLGIVTLYYPNVEHTAKNISAYLPFIDKLIAWNNTDKENNIQRELINALGLGENKILWKENLENLGLAKAYNFAFDYGKGNGYDLVLLMDQDSLWEDFSGFLDRVKREYSSNNVFVYTPNINGYDAQTSDVLIKDYYINSGTILPYKIIEKIGPQDETFKIDALDVDYSIRVRKRGFKIICFTRYILSHSIGNPKRSKVFHISSPNHSAYRTYSIAFSHIVLIKKHYKDLNNKTIWYYVREYIVYKYIRILFVENDKSNKLKMLYRGIHDGLKYKL